jgi:hypothetical protein
MRAMAGKVNRARRFRAFFAKSVNQLKPVRRGLCSAPNAISFALFGIAQTSFMICNDFISGLAKGKCNVDNGFVNCFGAVGDSLQSIPLFVLWQVAAAAAVLKSHLPHYH